MDALQFAFWLRGFYEINGETALTAAQSLIISQHLALVFEQKAKTLAPVSTWKPFSLEDVSVSSAISKAEDLVDAYKDMKRLVLKSGGYTPPTTISCRDFHPSTAKIC